MSDHGRLLSAGAIVSVAFSLASCNSPSPAVPTLARNTPSPTASRLAAAAATLVASTFTLSPVKSGEAAYEVKLQLSETGNRSGATLQSVAFTHLSGKSVVLSDLGCIPIPPSFRSHIGPGETWDMSALGYCAPDAIVDSSITTTVTVTVMFIDDFGQAGTMTASTDVN